MASSAMRTNFITFFDTATSPDNEWLLAASNYGDIFAWNLKDILAVEKPAVTTHWTSSANNTFGCYGDDDDEDDDGDDDIDNCMPVDTSGSGPNHAVVATLNRTPEQKQSLASNKPSFVFRAYSTSHLEPIYRLTTHERLLLVGAFDALYIYDWDTILGRLQECAHTTSSHGTQFINIRLKHKYIAPQMEYGLGAKSGYVEINCMVAHPQTHSVYLGTGHCDIFEFDLRQLQMVRHMPAHHDYVLDLAINVEANVLLSSSNDGSLKVWNLKTSSANEEQKSIVTFRHDHAQQAQASIAHARYYANCCDIHDNGRLIAGGFATDRVSQSQSHKNRICVYELNMHSCVATIEHEQNLVPQTVQFSSTHFNTTHYSNIGALFVGYNTKELHLYQKPSDAGVRIDTHSKSIWSVKQSNRMVVACGVSSFIDVVSDTFNSITTLCT